MEPENDGFQKESLFPGADFQMFKLQGCSVFFEGGEVILINKMFAYKGTIMWDLVGVCFGRGGCGGNYILTPPPQKQKKMEMASEYCFVAWQQMP